MKRTKKWSKEKPKANLMLASFGNKFPMDLWNWFSHWQHSPQHRPAMEKELAALVDRCVKAKDGYWLRQMAAIIEQGNEQEDKQRTWLLAMQMTGRAEKMTVTEIAQAAGERLGWEPEIAYLRRLIDELGIVTAPATIGCPRGTKRKPRR